MNTKHTDTVEAKNIAIHLTAILDKEVFKGQYSSSGLEAIEAIINRELTTFQATQSQQVEEAVRKERERHLNDLIRIAERIIRKEVTVEEYLVRWKEMLQALTPNHQD